MSAIRSRLNDIPVYQREAESIKARCFNQVRLALLRVGNPLRLALPSLRDLDIQLTDDAWVCVDRTLNDVPVVAWTDFAAFGRTALHEPIACEVRYYHAHAHLIVDTLLGDLNRSIQVLLDDQTSHGYYYR